MGGKVLDWVLEALGELGLVVEGLVQEDLVLVD